MVLHITTRDIFQINYLKTNTNHGNGAVVHIATLFESVYHVACETVF